MINPKLIKELISKHSLPLFGTHGLPHWGRVLEAGLRLSEDTGADKQVVTLFAVFHDCAREDEGKDLEHGGRGAEVAEKLRGKLFDIHDSGFDKLIYACNHHTEGLVDSDPTIGTCWDADRLDLWRIGISPDPLMLCTDAAKVPEMLEMYRSHGETEYIPNFVIGEWLEGMGQN